MGGEYSAKVFRSGNSVALRLPKALGLREGDVMRLREERGGFMVEPAVAATRKIRGDWIGSMPDLEPLTPEDRAFEADQLDWTGARLPRDG